ncbi:Tyrosine recombinase XerD [Mycobacterium persicum]|uniref:Tyrosine recombinase XerD n=1 Tax=Mycobacterium persicum TaxID=1487726 RepID=A0ABY6RSA3_9MYCO|nr:MULTISPECIES: site-specific integrase [Mycobacterium]VAZ81072.1 Tyrosine recombinase XerD [Mycobacterium persicum]VBA32515.1 Tyrosine recombinase XerD [Mycobacterium persicum]
MPRWPRGGAGNRSFLGAARAFLDRWPNPQGWAQQPLPVRLSAGSALRPLLNYLMLTGFLRPGYDYLLERKLSAILREARTSPLATDVTRFLSAATELGYSTQDAAALASQVAVRMLIQTGHPLNELNDAAIAEFAAAITAREQAHGRQLQHYRTALYATRAVLYHLDGQVTPTAKNTAHLRWPWRRHFAGVPTGLTDSLVAYLECASGTRTRSTVLGIAGCLRHFAQFLTEVDPPLTSLEGLDRQRHIEPYLAAVATARNPRTGTTLSASHRRFRILTVARLIDDINEWGWAEAPGRKLVFARDVPRLPRALPRYLPPDADRRLSAALHASPNRLRADALLLLRATGMRIGELCDLELDCVHEVPGAGAWLKVPLGKLDTERMVPIDNETLELVDRIVAHRSPGKPLPHPRTGKPVQFLLTHQGRRVSVDTLRDELIRSATKAGLKSVTPHQLRHTYATALINCGVSLQALMAMLGHVSAEMSLRYGRLFDETVRADYERALTQAKAQLGPVLPTRTPLPIADISAGATDWKDTPTIKARMAGGYCLRTPAQEACVYANICEHCPNFRTESTYLPILATQRADAAALAADAQARGWDQEATRHRRLVDRLDQLMNQTDTP